MKLNLPPMASQISALRENPPKPSRCCGSGQNSLAELFQQVHDGALAPEQPQDSPAEAWGWGTLDLLSSGTGGLLTLSESVDSAEPESNPDSEPAKEPRKGLAEITDG